MTYNPKINFVITVIKHVVVYVFKPYIKNTVKYKRSKLLEGELNICRIICIIMINGWENFGQFMSNRQVYQLIHILHYTVVYIYVHLDKYILNFYK